MHILESLYSLAGQIGEGVIEKGYIDCESVAFLIEDCRKLPPTILRKCDYILEILDLYEDIKTSVEISDEVPDETPDCDECKSWPDEIRSDLETVEKYYEYRKTEDDDWEVYSVDIHGYEEWVANVVTEAVASKLACILN
jgi:hypothetical protein